jgi:hypothetical protein
MKNKIITGFIFLMAFAIGSTFGNVISYFIWPSKHHLCECEYCKTVRQREAVEVMDSIIHERIVININKEK